VNKFSSARTLSFRAEQCAKVRTNSAPIESERVSGVRISLAPPASPYLWRYSIQITEKPAPAASFAIMWSRRELFYGRRWAIRGQNLRWQIRSDRLGRGRNGIEADEADHSRWPPANRRRLLYWPERHPQGSGQLGSRSGMPNPTSITKRRRGNSACNLAAGRRRMWDVAAHLKTSGFGH
jgi:hypothetical protein